MAIFRDEPKMITAPNPRYQLDEYGYAPTGISRDLEICEITLTWHDLLEARNLTPQTNNKKTVLGLLQDLQKVTMVNHHGTPEDVIKDFKEGKIAEYGSSSNIIYSIDWMGTGLNDKVIIRFGASVRKMFLDKKLVSLNADVQFKLKKGFSKNIWPYIDSRPYFTWIDESKICELLGVDIWDDTSDADTRKRHREDVREAFADMVQAGGILQNFTEKVTGHGRRKERRYFYTHALNFNADQAKLAGTPQAA